MFRAYTTIYKVDQPTGLEDIHWNSKTFKEYFTNILFRLPGRGFMLPHAPFAFWFGSGMYNKWIINIK